MAITTSTLFSNARLGIKNIVKNNVTDPKTRFKVDIVKSGRVAYPSQTNFCGYPYINIPPVDVASETEYVNDLSSSVIEWEQPIEVLSEDNTFLDSMSDQIFSILKSTANKNTMIADGVKIERVTNSGYTEDIIEGKQVHVRKISVRFRNRI